MTDVASPPAASPNASDPTTVNDAPRRELMLGGGILVAFFVFFLGWAAFAPLDAGAYAQGQIAVSGNRQAVQHREGGVVASLHVAEGDTVRQGQVLLTLTSGELRATERGVAGQVYALLAQRARLAAERDGLPTVPTPAGFAKLAPPAARLPMPAGAAGRRRGPREPARTAGAVVMASRFSRIITSA